jgi:hypothetical protein
MILIGRLDDPVQPEVCAVEEFLELIAGTYPTCGDGRHQDIQGLRARAAARSSAAGTQLGAQEMPAADVALLLSGWSRTRRARWRFRPRPSP